MITKFFQIELAVSLAFAEAGADRGDHVANFRVGQHLVVARLLDVQELAADRQERLEAPIASLFGRTAGAVALDDVQLAQRGVALGAIGQFAGQPATRHRALAHRFAGLPGRFARAGRGQNFVNDAASGGRILFQKTQQPVIDDRVNDALHLTVRELRLRLSLEAWLRHLHADDRDQSFTHVVTGKLRVLLLHQLAVLGVLVDRLGQRAAESAEARAALDVGDRARVRKNLFVVAVVVVDRDLGHDAILLLVEVDRLGVDRVFVLAQVLDELGDAALELERLSLVVALVLERDVEARVEERQFAETVRHDVPLELARQRENLRVGHEGDLGASRFRLADHRHLRYGFPALEPHVIDLSLALDLGLEPLAHGVHAFRADALQAAADRVRALAELASGVEIGEHEFERGHLELRVHVHGNAATDVLDRDGAVDVDRDDDLGAEPGERLVDGVVHDLEHAMVQAALARVADVHVGPLADAFESLQFFDLGGVVGFRGFGLCVGRFLFGVRQHFLRFWVLLIAHSLGAKSIAEDGSLSILIFRDLWQKQAVFRPLQGLISKRVFERYPAVKKGHFRPPGRPAVTVYGLYETTPSRRDY